jgi:hypothetical protein
MDIKTFVELCDAHDWTFMHSDDFQKYKRGRVVADRLEKAVKENGHEFRDIFKIKQAYYTRGIAL